MPSWGLLKFLWLTDTAFSLRRALASLLTQLSLSWWGWFPHRGQSHTLSWRHDFMLRRTLIESTRSLLSYKMQPACCCPPPTANPVHRPLIFVLSAVVLIAKNCVNSSCEQMTNQAKRQQGCWDGNCVSTALSWQRNICHRGQNLGFAYQSTCECRENTWKVGL